MHNVLEIKILDIKLKCNIARPFKTTQLDET